MENSGRSSDTQSKILAAARHEFVQNGRAGARMQSIADRAGVNKALLHYYFRTKDLLYKETVRDAMNIIWGRIRAELNRHNGSDDIRMLIRTIAATYIKTISENIDFARLLIREIADGGSVLRELAPVLRRAMGDTPETVMRVISSNREKGLIRSIDPSHFIINIMSMSAGTFAARFFFSIIGRDLPWPAEYNEQFIRKRIEEITETICNGIFIGGKNS